MKELKHDGGLYIKLPKTLKKAAIDYAAEKNITGGLSAMIRDFLEKRTKKRSKNISEKA